MGVYKYLDLKLEDGSKLRVRFMFDPTDDEIVDYYLNEEGLLSISSISWHSRIWCVSNWSNGCFLEICDMTFLHG